MQWRHRYCGVKVTFMYLSGLWTSNYLSCSKVWQLHNLVTGFKCDPFCSAPNKNTFFAVDGHWTPHLDCWLILVVDCLNYCFASQRITRVHWILELVKNIYHLCETWANYFLICQNLVTKSICGWYTDWVIISVNQLFKYPVGRWRSLFKFVWWCDDKTVTGGFTYVSSLLWTHFDCAWWQWWEIPCLQQWICSLYSTTYFQKSKQWSYTNLLTFHRRHFAWMSRTTPTFGIVPLVLKNTETNIPTLIWWNSTQPKPKTNVRKLKEINL